MSYDYKDAKSGYNRIVTILILAIVVITIIASVLNKPDSTSNTIITKNRWSDKCEK